jgi:nucleoside-diphosphate-sugar epimerase
VRLARLGPQVEVRDESDDLAPLLRGCAAVVDTKGRAADLGPDAGFARADAGFARRLLDAAADAGVGRVVLLSSLAVHRFDGSSDVDVRSRPRDRRELPYAVALRSIEDLVLAHPGVAGVVVRPGIWPVGSGDPVLWRLARALRGGRLPLVGGGAGVLNIVDADDLADGLLVAATHPTAVGRVYAMADPTRLTWYEVLTTLASLLGGRPPRRLLPTAPAQAVASVLERAYGAAVPTSEPSLTRYRTALLGTGLHVRVDDAALELDWRSATPWREALRRVAVEALARMGVAPLGRS